MYLKIQNNTSLVVPTFNHLNLKKFRALAQLKDFFLTFLFYIGGL